MRLVYAADLHGDVVHYAELANLARSAAPDAPDALVLGGDLFAHAPTPDAQVAFATGWLRGFVRGAPCPVYAVPGNVDWPAALAALADCVRFLDLAPLNLSGHPLLGYPFVPPTPFRRKDFERRDLAADAPSVPAGAYLSDTAGAVRPAPPDHFLRHPSIEEDLAALDRGAAGAVWAVHSPPHGTLNTAASGVHAGSRALAAAIRLHGPPLVLTGHIHEAPVLEGRWAKQVGRTLVVNPGRGRGLHAVTVDLGAAGEVVSADHSVLGSA